MITWTITTGKRANDPRNGMGTWVYWLEGIREPKTAERTRWKITATSKDRGGMIQNAKVWIAQTEADAFRVVLADPDINLTYTYGQDGSASSNKALESATPPSEKSEAKPHPE